MTTDEKDARASIVRYLRHIASVEVGSMLSPQGREIVDWCASWVENRLDEKWAEEMKCTASGSASIE